MLRAKIHPRHTEVIHNGADEQQFYPFSRTEVEQQRSALGLRDARLLITVGNVTERKGQDIVIRALPAILATWPNTHYLVVGLPSSKSQFLAIAEELGVEGHVHFLGRVSSEDLVTYLNISDVFVMTSKRTADGDFEGYGIAVVEAALCGKPAVVSADSGLVEAITTGETGFLVPPNDPDATAECITRLLSDDSLRTQMGDKARTRALHEQTWQHRVNEYHDLLVSIVGKQLSSTT
jgi:glycosyltransferase involved in cell wall biosynthesis